MLGEGEMSYRGELISAAEGLEIAGLKPIDLAAKGLALLNGTKPRLRWRWKVIPRRRLVCGEFSDRAP